MIIFLSIGLGIDIQFQYTPRGDNDNCSLCFECTLQHTLEADRHTIARGYILNVALYRADAIASSAIDINLADLIKELT